MILLSGLDLMLKFHELMVLLSRLLLLASLLFLSCLIYTADVSAQPVESGLPDAGISNSSLSNSGLSNHSLGVKAYQLGEFRRAFDAWSLGAYEGDIEAQYNLGVLYLEGRGVERNLLQARNWFLKAARKQHLEAQYNLGHMAFSGMGTEKDTEAALKWWQQAAEGGYAQAQFNYGRALYLGVEGRQDKQAGLALIRAAADQRDQRAQKFLEQNAGDPARKSENMVVVEVKPTQVEPTSVAASGKALKQPPDAKKATQVAKVEQVLPKVAEYQPGREKLDIVRDQTEVHKDYFLRTVPQPVPVYALPDLSNQLDTLSPETLVKVLAIESDKLRIEVVTELLVWAKQAGLEQHDSRVTAPQSGLIMYQSPDGSPLGELPQNMNLLVVGKQDEWLQLKVPQHIYGWINARSLAYSGESVRQLRVQWTQQLSKLDQHPLRPDSVDVPQIDAESVAQSNQSLQTPATVIIDALPVPVEHVVTAINDNTWLFTQAQGAYSVHVFTLLDQARAQEIAAMPRFRSKAKLYTTQTQQQTWSFLLLGPYVDVDTAKVARSRLPKYLAKDARVRSIALIAENRCKKRFQLGEDEARGLDAYCLE